jgi:hypothetical protein
LVPRLSKNAAARLQVYSVDLELSGPGASALLQDFAYFRSQEPVATGNFRISLELVLREPLPKDLPALKAERTFPDCVLFRQGEREYFEYEGALLVVHRGKRHSSGTLISANAQLAHELGYLFLQSELGKRLDQQGLHRVHGMGLGLPSGKSALLLLPSGGGKTTLALALLQSGRGQLLSDDSPLVDLHGRLHPYPMRIACKPSAEIPPGWRASASEFHRRRHGTKLLIPSTALPGDRLPPAGSAFAPAYLLIGHRHGEGARPELRELPRAQGTLPLLRDMVVGLGLPQVAELVLSKGVRSLPGLAPVALSRARAAMALAARARVFEFQLARDPLRNARFLERELFGGRLA